MREAGSPPGRFVDRIEAHIKTRQGGGALSVSSHELLKHFWDTDLKDFNKGKLDTTLSRMVSAGRLARPSSRHYVVKGFRSPAAATVDQREARRAQALLDAADAADAAELIDTRPDSPQQRKVSRSAAQDSRRSDDAACVGATQGITDDALDEVLDLMFPNGFRAKHFRAVEAWKEATREFVRQVNA